MSTALLAVLPIVQAIATAPVVDIPQACAFSPQARTISSLRAAPEIAAEFKRLGVPIADVGEPYTPFDVVTDDMLPKRQFLRAYAFKDRMILWYYHGGGMATHVHVAEFRAQRDRRDGPEVLRATGRSLTGPPCQATLALLSGVGKADEW